MIESLTVDFDAVMKSKNHVVEKNAAGVEYLFKKNKITTERGRGRLLELTRDIGWNRAMAGPSLPHQEHGGHQYCE